jgi:uncharacterized repeat protein (TIGR01451 family)
LVGETVTYRATLSNTGAAVAQEILQIVDTLPIGFKYVTGTTDALSPGNTGAVSGPFTDDAAYDPVVAPTADAATNEVLTWTFNDPNDADAEVDEAKTHLVTGPSVDDTVTLSYDVIATDAVTPNDPAPGLNYNSVVVSANRIKNDPAPLDLPLVPVGVNILHYPSFVVLKTVVTTNDPIVAAGDAVNPHAIPGAEVLYTVRITNTGFGSADATTIVINDPIPANTELFVGDLNAGEPFIFINGAGAASSTLTCPFVSLATLWAPGAGGDCIEFLGAGSTSFAPTPDYDNTVNSIVIQPTGTFAGNGGGSNTYFEFQFRVRVK